jgi:hypothetical protein
MTDKDTETLTARLIALHSALVNKTGEQPFIEPALRLSTKGEWNTDLYRAYNNGDYRLGAVKGATPEACLDAAFAFVAALPDPETAARTAWHKDLAGVIDRGHALNLPDEVMTPLRQGSQAMTENLLTKETTA